MKVDTKFEIGEELWYLKSGKVYAVCLNEIRVSVRQDCLTWSATMTFLDLDKYASGNMAKHPQPTDLFRTKEEAGQEMMKRAGFDCSVVLR